MNRPARLARWLRASARRLAVRSRLPAAPTGEPAFASRSDRLLAGLDRSMRLIEIGPSHAPLAAKRDGWRTTVVDHAPRQALAEKYAGHSVDIGRIEDVDVIWSGGDLAGKFPPADLGAYHAMLASHVMEHMPDPISFLKSAQRLLTPDGIVVLALPDRRYTFDFFQPLTTTADWLIAHENRATTHSKRAAFNHMAYNVANGTTVTWGHTKPLTDLRLTLSLRESAKHFDFNDERGHNAHYHDYHAWHFTPASFHLLILESAILCDLDFRVAECSTAIGHEFYVRLARGRSDISDAELDAQRLNLLRAAVQECRAGTNLLPARS